MALAYCILGKFLGAGCHCFPPPLDIPTFSARCLHVQRCERTLAAKGGTLRGGEMFRQIPSTIRLYIYTYMKIVGILPENIPIPLYSTLQYVTYRASSSMFPTVITAITMKAPVVTRSHLLLHSDLMEPLPHFPPHFLLLSRGLAVHYTPAEIQRGIIYSIYSSPLSFIHYVFPFVPFLLPSWIWLCLKSLCKVTSLSTVWNIFQHWAIIIASAWKLRVSMGRQWQQNTYEGHLESKESSRIQPAQLFQCSWWVMWCVQ
jgi:hypothetical protein